ncbi:MAG: aldehyde oxidase [Rubritepida sp.]|jgi:xanthine dehydrogenase YagR molybdenum-binding subunit|nr:aldehyde oxidase [Rubritepida sp.]
MLVGIVIGIGRTLHEKTFADTEHAVPAHADVEIGTAGTAAAVANAIHHATGKRIRSLPITIGRLTG